MKYRLIFEGDIIEPHIKDQDAQVEKAMEACFHLLWGYMINVDPAQCTFSKVDSLGNISPHNDGK